MNKTTSSSHKCIILCLFAIILQSCASSNTLVEFSRDKIPTLGRIGILSVYDPVGPAGGLIDLAFGNKDIEQTVGILKEASPAEDIRKKFSMRVSPVIGSSFTEICEEVPDIANIKETGKFGRIFYDLEKLDYNSIKKSFSVDTLIIIKTHDNVFRGNTPFLIIYMLYTHAKMISISNKEVLWEKKVVDGLDVNISKFSSSKDLKEAMIPVINNIIDELAVDFDRMCQKTAADNPTNKYFQAELKTATMEGKCPKCKEVRTRPVEGKTEAGWQIKCTDCTNKSKGWFIQHCGKCDVNFITCPICKGSI